MQYICPTAQETPKLGISNVGSVTFPWIYKTTY